MKLFSKIAALSVGLAMAVGVGVAVGHKSVGEAKADYTAKNSLSAGDVIYMTYSTSSANWELTSVTSGTKGNVESFSGTSLKGTYPLTVEVSGDNYYFKDSDNKYIAYTGTATSSQNKIWLVDSSSSNGAAWTVSFSGTDATIKNVYNTSRYLKGNAQSGSERICGYTTTGTLTLYSASGVGPTPTEQHDITFNANAGTDTVTGMPSTLVDQSGTIQLSSVSSPSREGYKFKGWSLTSDGETVPSVTIETDDIELFAIWEEVVETDYVETVLKEGNLLVTTSWNGNTYYLPTDEATSSGPLAVLYTDVGEIDPENLWNVSKDGDNWVFQNADGKYMWASSSTANNGIRVNDGPGSWEVQSDGSLKNPDYARYLGIYNGADWRSYNSSGATNYKESATSLKFYEVSSVDPELDTLVVKMNGSETSPQSIGYGIGSILLDAYDGESTVISEWASSNTSVATVALNSLNRAVVTFVAPGEVTITASKSGYNDGVFKLTITKGDLQSVAISGSLTKTTYATTEAWSHDGLTATATYSTGWQEDVSSSATWTYNPSAPVEDLEQVTITATLSEKSDSKSCNISVTPVPSTPISWFYENKSSIDSDEIYSIKGTCIGIQGNSYYLQDGEYGMLVYGGSTTPPTGLAIGKKVLVNSKVQFFGTGFEEQIFETSGTPSASILGEGNLPTALIVDTAAGFASANQNTYVTFNGLKSFSWTQAPVFSGTMKDGIGVAEDKNGTSVSVFVSRYIGSTEGTKIVNALAAITEDDTFDVVRSIKAIASGGDNKGKGQVSILSSDQIVVHTPEEDAVQTWIDTYMYMEDSRFDGDGTGLCYSNNIYVTAKTALIALGETNVAKFEANAEGKYDAAKARYLEWARICKDSAPFEDDFSFTSLSINISSYQSNIDSSSSITIIVIVAVTSMTLLGVTLVIRKRKHQ